MTAALLSFAVIIGVFLGLLFGGLDRPKPAWWKVMTSILLVGLVMLGFGIPMGGSFTAAEMIRDAEGGDVAVPVWVSKGDGTYLDRSGQTRTIDFSRLDAGERESAMGAESLIVTVTPEDDHWSAESLEWVDPPMTFPLIPALRERARNIFFHVPAAWIATMAWFVAAFYALRYTRRKDIDDDVRASSAAAVGFLFCATATISGSIWSRFDWGSFWNWDPRQVSIVVVLMIFGAYFALRSALETREVRARISSVYILLMALPVLFFIGVFPRLMKTLHPNNLTLNTEMSLLFPVAALSLTLLYFWLTNLTVRIRLFSVRREEKRYASIMDRDGSSVQPVKVAMPSENERHEG